MYYYQLPDSTIVFSSEIKAILALVQEINRVCSLDMLNLYIRFENFPQGDSLIQGIKLLEPGRILHLTINNQNTVQSWNDGITIAPSAYSKELSREDLLTITREKIIHSVRSHLLSDVPLGVYLSGGIDSSLVASIASEYTDNILGFTGYFDVSDKYYDERPLARAVAHKYGIRLQEIPITPEDFVNSFDRMIYALDEPRMGMGAFSQYIVAQEAAKHRKVILAGHGGDELFGGYPLFKVIWLLETGLSWRSLPCIASLNPKEWPWIIDQFSEYIRTRHVRFAPELFTGTAKRVKSYTSTYNNIFRQPKSKSPLEQLGKYYFSVYLPGLLIVEDKISMAHSLETRVPLWSQELIAWVSQIPISEKIRNGTLKGLLKEIAMPWLPQEILNAPKRGFPTPLRIWFRGTLNDYIKEKLLDTETPLHQLFSKTEITKLLNSHQKHPLPFALDERRAHQIWILLSLESWMRQFKIQLIEKPSNALASVC